MDSEELINRFVTDLKIRRKSPSTLITYSYTIKAFSTFIDGNLLTVTKNKLVEYLETMVAKNFRQPTIVRYFVVIREFYKFLIYNNLYNLPNPISDKFWRYYLEVYKGGAPGVRRCPTTDEVITLLNSVLNTRDKAVLTLLFATGIRRKELSELDRSDVNLETGTIILKETRKRTNRTVFINPETIFILRRYLNRREDDNPALFISRDGTRLGLLPIDVLFKKAVKHAGLYRGDETENALTPHCCRHWFTTTLFNASMRSEYIGFLRGDKPKTSAGVYIHIIPELVKAEYLRCMPNLGLL
jgi:integrase/recombinase XerD